MLIVELGKGTEMCLVWVWDYKLSGSKIAKIVIYDKMRVNGGTNYDSPGQRWVPKLVIDKSIK